MTALLHPSSLADRRCAKCGGNLLVEPDEVAYGTTVFLDAVCLLCARRGEVERVEGGFRPVRRRRHLRLIERAPA